MTGLSPSVNDSSYALWKKVAYNWWVVTQNAGLVGVNEPSVNDTEQDLQRKTAYYTALINDYLHP